MRCTQSAYHVETNGLDSFLRRAEITLMFQRCCESANQFISSVKTTGQLLVLCPTSLLDGPILCSKFSVSTPDTYFECSMRSC